MKSIFGEARGDPTRPLPPIVWLLLSSLLSIVFFLGLRLLVVSWAQRAPRPPAELPPAAAASAAPRDGPGPVRPMPPPSSDAAFAALVEGWRRAWVDKDLPGYLGHYATTFGCQGKDLAAWAEHKRGVFASAAPIEVEVSDLVVIRSDAIAMVRFVQTYRSEGYQDRGVKTLYLLPEQGRWRIFNEEWSSESPP